MAVSELELQLQQLPKICHDLPAIPVSTLPSQLILNAQKVAARSMAVSYGQAPSADAAQILQGSCFSEETAA